MSENAIPPDGNCRMKVEYWPSGAVKYRGAFAGDSPRGQHVTFWEDGRVAHLAWYDDCGVPRGTIMSFYRDGAKDSEDRYDDSGCNAGTFSRVSFDAEGKVFQRTTFVDFRLVESWEAPDVSLDDEENAIVDDIVRKALAETNDHEFD